MKNKFISNRVIKLNDGTIFFTQCDKEPSVACDWSEIFFTSDKNRPTRDEIYFIDFWRENLSMYRINHYPADKSLPADNSLFSG